MNVSVLYNSIKNIQEEWRSFSQFSGIMMEMHPVWDENRKARGHDWSGGKYSVPYALIESLLLLALNKYKSAIINV